MKHRECELWGECDDPAVKRFIVTPIDRPPESLWGCRAHAVWWRQRHPEATEAPPGG